MAPRMSQSHEPLAPAADSELPQPTAAAPRYRRIAMALAGVMLLLVASVGSAPFWAPLLPWAAAPEPASPDTGQIGRPEPPAAGPQESPPQAEAPPQNESSQSEPLKVERPPPGPREEAAGNAELERLGRRLDALEARSSSPTGDIADIRRELAKLSTATADLNARVAALDKTAPAAPAADPTDMALVLALLQIRGAIAVGRPFAAEYDALAGLARTRPEIAAAAAPLAEPAKTGLATRMVLASRLRELAGAMAVGKVPLDAAGPADAASPDWTERALTQLRGLVAVRRTGGTDRGSPDGSLSGESLPGGGSSGGGSSGGHPPAPVTAAELALAGGDLEGAVGALGGLTGGPAETAISWLRLAKQRLAVEAALLRIETLLVARLGNVLTVPSSAPGGAGLPQ